ncbi:MAG: hypothetical protein IJ689_05070 [Alphaproteobacteria bacterium]|nr:hypothetical protein [Alphaproteobacteria bacterium]
MLWIAGGLIYGFFTAIYTIFNQHYKLDGYLLGIWRGFGISLIFLPFFCYFDKPDDLLYWGLLTAQGIMIGIYDSHLFFASALYGAGPVSRIMALSTVPTTFLWWMITPQSFNAMLTNEALVLTIVFLLIGFTASYWNMIKSEVTKELASYMMPAIISLAGMSILTKEIALRGADMFSALSCYLTVSTFISGVYNSLMFIKKYHLDSNGFIARVLAQKVRKAGVYIVSFSSVLIIAKTIALRIAPNPGYVTVLLLTAPLFVYALNKYNHIPDEISVKSGFYMIGFLSVLVALTAINPGVID